MEKEQISYNDANKELNTILEEIKMGNTDVDSLSAKVKRAKELIGICEERIKKAEMEIKEIIKTSL